MTKTLLIIPAIVIVCCAGGPAFAADPLPIYRPKVKLADIYFHHPGAKPALAWLRQTDGALISGCQPRMKNVTFLKTQWRPQLQHRAYCERPEWRSQPGRRHA